MAFILTAEGSVNQLKLGNKFSNRGTIVLSVSEFDSYSDLEIWSLG